MLTSISRKARGGFPVLFQPDFHIPPPPPETPVLGVSTHPRQQEGCPRSCTAQCWALGKHLSTVPRGTTQTLQLGGRYRKAVITDGAISKYSLCVLAGTCTKAVRFQWSSTTTTTTLDGVWRYPFQRGVVHCRHRTAGESGLRALRQHLPSVYTR